MLLGSLTLEAADDGAGLPPSFSQEEFAGPGMRVVQPLIRQLDSHIDVLPSQRGAAFRISVPLLANDACQHQ